LVLVVKTANGDYGILIENKVDAAPQPAQAARYKLRGIAGVEAGTWAGYSSCLVAPAKYLTSERNTSGYDATISYEDIGTWIRETVSDSTRSEFKTFLLNEAIEQNRRGYVARMDAQVTRFFTEYWEFAENVFPELKFRHLPSRPVGSTWAEFRPNALKKGRLIYHKVTEGVVDLQLSALGERVDQLNDLNQNLLANDVHFVRTGKSASLRAEVTPVNHRGEFSSQRDSALAALKAAYRLLTLEKLIRE
jgi:hypothetical protein